MVERPLPSHSSCVNFIGTKAEGQARRGKIIRCQHGARVQAQQERWNHGLRVHDLCRDEGLGLWNSQRETGKGISSGALLLQRSWKAVLASLSGERLSSLCIMCLFHMLSPTVQDAVGNYYDCRLTLQAAVVSAASPILHSCRLHHVQCYPMMSQCFETCCKSTSWRDSGPGDRVI